MPIKTIFFDFGGVIIQPPKKRRIDRLKKLLGIDIHPEMQKMFENPNQSKLVQDICLGILPEEKLWEIMADKWQVKPALIQHLRKSLESKRHLNKPLIKFMAECQRQYSTAILSNAGDQSRRLMEDVFHLDDYVDDIIISAEEGVIKPDPKIYWIALERLEAKPETSLLLDDTQENVFAARDIGMKAIQFVNNDQSIPMMRKILNTEG